jgi:hypothetical protein
MAATSHDAERAAQAQLARLMQTPEGGRAFPRNHKITSFFKAAPRPTTEHASAAVSPHPLEPEVVEEVVEIDVQAAHQPSPFQQADDEAEERFRVLLIVVGEQVRLQIQVRRPPTPSRSGQLIVSLHAWLRANATLTPKPAKRGPYVQ